MCKTTEALSFAVSTEDAQIHGRARAKIFSLLDEIREVYQAHIQSPSGTTCEICGKGDSNEYLKVGRILNGYRHRPSLSPRLCHPHASGWSRTFSILDSKRRVEKFCVNGVTQADIATYHHTPVLTDHEIDLHFAYYLATQLMKESRKETA